jgi:ADP-heptose:LPS heptosyltransferase
MPFRFPIARLPSLAPRRIGIIKPSALGDVVQALRLLPALRRRYPQATIHWIINRGFADLLESHPDLTGAIPFDRRGSWREFARLLSRLRGMQFDLVLDLQGLLRSAVLTLATGAPVRVGLETAREGAGWGCNCVLPGTGWSVPAHRRIENVAAALGMQLDPLESGLLIPDAARSWAAQRLQSLRRPILAVHPGAGWVTKRWPAEPLLRNFPER